MASKTELTANQANFVKYYAEPTSETFGQIGKSAERAGYANPSQAATHLMNNPKVQKALDAYKVKQQQRDALTIMRIQQDYEDLYQECRKEGDRTTARACLHDMAKTVGGFLDISQTTIKSDVEDIPQERKTELERAARQLSLKVSTG